MKKPVYKNIYNDLEDGGERAKVAEREWKALCLDLEMRDLMTDQRKRIVDRLVRERVEYEFLFPIAIKAGHVNKGPKGGEYVNLHWSALQRTKDQILKLEEALRLTVDRVAAPTGKIEKKTKASKYLGRLGPN
ncbi:hypothetical protein [Pseudophaeobacter sp.]|uniref:hypothetical protein n=1 Tax=Pseudophaeobacter sp. TaxID=1971739 RepID=UPI0032971420